MKVYLRISELARRDSTKVRIKSTCFMLYRVWCMQTARVWCMQTARVIFARAQHPTPLPFVLLSYRPHAQTAVVTFCTHPVGVLVSIVQYCFRHPQVHPIGQATHHIRTAQVSDHSLTPDGLADRVRSEFCERVECC